MDPDQTGPMLSNREDLSSAPSAHIESDNPIPSCSESRLRELMILAPSGISDTVRHSFTSVVSQCERRLRNGTTAVAPADKPLQLGKHTQREGEETGEQLRKKEPLCFLTLPPELQLMVFERLNFGDIERLRRTCKQLRYLASPRRIRALLGPMRLRIQMLRHCKVCLEFDSTRSNLLLSTPADVGYPLSSSCIRCALDADDPRIRVGKKLELANFEAIWVCRWCGLPVQEQRVSGNDQFHPRCYNAYSATLFRYFLLGLIQLSLGIVAAALSWRYFRHASLVFGPTVTSFLLLWLCLGFLVFRGNTRRTYHWTLFLELTILGLWIPPVYYISSGIARSTNETIPRATLAALAMFVLNMLFRLLNVLGNIALFFEYDLTRRNRPQASMWRKLTHPMMCWLIFWTYPQSLDRKYLDNPRPRRQEARSGGR